MLHNDLMSVDSILLKYCWKSWKFTKINRQNNKYDTEFELGSKDEKL